MIIFLIHSQMEHFTLLQGVYIKLLLEQLQKGIINNYTTSYTLSLKKDEEAYKEIFNIINKNIKEYQLKNNLKVNYKLKYIHCNMESALINGNKFIWSYSIV